ncbi:Hypothetical protein CAP_7347 [Chondromyces apiculatus DSM 436]|uniref:Uncharacterized protein n=1 Tax=Chondromyces apiculatus DSM 436 TaxID=1192034 RepID=A0A017T089_9BACT|nr:Hypothetical protein CAP_7347 [Chondromyces apiculatus DSM 436]
MTQRHHPRCPSALRRRRRCERPRPRPRPCDRRERPRRRLSRRGSHGTIGQQSRSARVLHGSIVAQPAPAGADPDARGYSPEGRLARAHLARPAQGRYPSIVPRTRAS